MSPNNGTQLCVFVQVRLVLTKYSQITAHFEAWNGIQRRGWWYLQYLGWPVDLNINKKSLVKRWLYKISQMTQNLTSFRVILSAIVRGPPRAMIDTSELCSKASKESHHSKWRIYLQCNPQRSQFAKTKHQPHLQPRPIATSSQVLMK